MKKKHLMDKTSKSLRHPCQIKFSREKKCFSKAHDWLNGLCSYLQEAKSTKLPGWHRRKSPGEVIKEQIKSAATTKIQYYHWKRNINNLFRRESRFFHHSFMACSKLVKWPLVKWPLLTSKFLRLLKMDLYSWLPWFYINLKK